ncbi:MAG: DUF4143 domain-containing protein [Clostridia bacterium]|nr:DUF4143 domain-containing protein [Clostridia bacterium]
MELKRKAYDALLQWKKESNGTTALLIDGARRVGKSHLAEYFATKEYKSYILINFSKASKALKDIFLNDLMDLDLFFNKLSLMFGKELYTRQSLLIFDEVQRFPRAREAIKFLVEDGRYDYIETGSLISLKQNTKDIVIPSEEEHMELNPLDFEEFLWAMGDTVTVPLLRKCYDNLQPLGDAVHRKIMNSFRQYLLVGGMPQAVSEYATSKSFAKVDRIKKTILNLYRQDITRFAKGYESKVLAIFDQIPSQLSKREKKFSITSLSKDARTRTYEDSFMWLKEGMITNNCYNSTDPSVGLSMSLDETSQKLYMLDTGLLVTHTFKDDTYMTNELYKSVLLDKISVNEGMLMENAVAQAFRASGHNLFFYSRSDNENRENNLEIDFLLLKKGKICPVEVKSSSYTTHSSLDKYMKKFKGRHGQAYIIYSKDLQVKDNIVHLPIYMAMFL